jgi:hypothetical protein
MYEINFIKWKWLITKSIDELIVWAWFEVSIQLYELLLKQVDKVMTLYIESDWKEIQFDTYICTDTWTYLVFKWDHAIVRLDIVLPSILLSSYILKWNIKLWLNK